MRRFLIRRRLYFAAILFIFSSFCTLFCTQPTIALAANWLDQSITPSIQKIHDNLPIESIPEYNNKDCTPNVKLTTTPNRFYPQPQAEINQTTCVTLTAFGLQSSNQNLLQRPGTNVAGPIISNFGQTLVIDPIPSSNDLIFTTSATNGVHINLVKNVNQKLTTTPLLNESILHKLSYDAQTQVIKDESGLPLQFRERRYSKNGKWIVSDSPGRGTTRINSTTGEILTFGDSYSYTNGIRPNFVMAISSSGRFAALYENQRQIFKLYDLSTCEKPTNPSTIKQECQHLDLWNLTKSSIQNFSYIRHLSFLNEDVLNFYAKHDDKQGRFTMLAPGANQHKLDYLALGDSFVSGEGALSYVPGTDIQNPFNKCHLSLLSYPFLLANHTPLNSAESVACSGAKMKDLIFSNTENYNQPQSQGKSSPSFDQEIYNQLLVGYRPQINFIDAYQPKIISASIGGNDIGFSKIVISCIKPGTCFDSPSERLNLVHTINSKFNDLVTTFNQIKDHSGGSSQIYVHGYPELVKPNAECALNVRLNNYELDFANRAVGYLNQVIEKAAKKVGVSYIDVSQVLHGHRLCETGQSNIAVNGITMGDDKTFDFDIPLLEKQVEVFLSGRESFHPNALGHSLYAKHIANHIKLKSPPDQTLPAPQNPDPTIQDPKISDAQSLINGDINGLSPKKLSFSNISSRPLILKNSPLNLTAADLAISQNYSAYLNDALLGQISSDSSGKIATSFPVPDIPPGVYDIKLLGPNIAGEDYIYIQLVFVGQNQLDLDDDNIKNSDDSCPLLANSNQDIDQDYVDDSCDRLILATPGLTPSLSILNALPNNPGKIFSILSPEHNPHNQLLSSSDQSTHEQIRPPGNPMVKNRDESKGSNFWAKLTPAIFFSFLAMLAGTYVLIIQAKNWKCRSKKINQNI